MISNKVKNLFFIFFVSLFLQNCSTSKKITEKSSDYTSKMKSAQDSYKGAQDTYKQADDMYNSAGKMTNNFKFKDKPTDNAVERETAPDNIPPPQDISQLPVYGSTLERVFGKVIRINSTVEQGANQNFPIIFDLVFVKDPDIYEMLTTTTTRNWFKVDRVEIQELKKKTKLLDIQEITVIPEKQHYLKLIRVPSDVKAGLFYVRMIGNDNLYPTVFDPYKDIDLDFNANNFILNQQ